jgi:hypothetical protein
VIVESFDRKAALAAATCPRCNCVGLVESDYDQWEAASQADRHYPKGSLEPSVYARCTACNVMTEWPSCEAG